jgi:hypothetical protein
VEEGGDGAVGIAPAGFALDAEDVLELVSGRGWLLAVVGDHAHAVPARAAIARAPSPSSTRSGTLADRSAIASASCAATSSWRTVSRRAPSASVQRRAPARKVVSASTNGTMTR